jgi:hypothetical protein
MEGDTMFWAIVFFSVGTGSFGYWMGLRKSKKNGFALDKKTGYNGGKSKYDIPLRESANHKVKPSVKEKSLSDVEWIG